MSIPKAIRSARIALAVALSAVSCNLSPAATIYWTGDFNRFWGVDPSNWSPASIPTAADDLIFDDSSSEFMIDLGNANRFANSITIDSETAYSFVDQNGSQSIFTSSISVESGTGHSFDVPIVLGADGIFSVLTDLTVSGVISGAHSLTKQSTGTLTLTGDNTYSGNTFIQGGTLQVGNGGTEGAILGDVSTEANTTLGFNRSDAISFDGLISGDGGLTQAGSGSLTLNSANTFTGATNINAGSIVLGNSLALQNSTVNINLANGLDLNGADATLGALAGTGTLALADEKTLTVGGNDADTSYSGVLSGLGSLTKTGDGDLTLSGINTFTGDTSIDGGSIVLSGSFNQSLKNSTVHLNVDNGLTSDGVDYYQLGGLSGSGNWAIELFATDIEIGSNGKSTTYSGNITGGNGTIVTKVGDGSLTLTGTGHNSGATIQVNDGSTIIFDGAMGSFGNLEPYTGSKVKLKNAATISIDDYIRVSGGELLVTGAGTHLESGSFMYSYGTAVIEDGAVLEAEGNRMSDAGSLTIDKAYGSFGYLHGFSGNRIYLADLSGLGALAIGTDADIEEDFRGIIADLDGLDLVNGIGSLTKVGSNTQILSGANTYTGGTNILGGTLQIGADGTTGSLAGDVYLGDVDDNGVLAFKRSDATSFDGLISGSGGLAQNGAGSLTLTAANTFTGDTNINAGSIIIGNALALQNSIVNVNVANGLNLNGFTPTFGGLRGSSALNLGADTLTIGNNDASTSYTGVISGTGGLTKTGTGTLTLSGVHTFTGDTTISEGSIKLLGVVGEISKGLQNSTVYVNVDGGLDLSGPHVVLLGNLAGSGDVDVSDLDFYLLNDESVTYAGNITGSSSDITKEGSGDWTLTGQGHDAGSLYAYDGAVIFDGAEGTFYNLFAFDDGAFVIKNGAAIEVTNSLKVDANATFLIAGEETSVTSGTGNDFDIAGAMTISDGAHVSAPLYIRLNNTGALTIDEARLETGSLINFGSPGIQISDPLGYSALTVGGEGDDGLFTGTITDGLNGAGSLVKVGTNTQILSGANTYSGGTIITGGTLQIGNGGTVGLIMGDIDTGTADSNGVLAFKRSDNITFDGSISGSGGIVKDGAGSLTLNGEITNSGTTIINAGSLVLNGPAAIFGGLGGSGDLALGSQTLTVGGNDASTTYTGVISGTGGLTKTGTGTLTLSGVHTFTGDTTINEGSIKLLDAVGEITKGLQNSTVYVNVDGGLDLSGNDAVLLGSLAGSGDVDLSNQFIYLYNDDSVTYSGNFTAATASNSEIEKHGAGDWTLTGTGHVSTPAISNFDGSVIFDGAEGTFLNLFAFDDGAFVIKNGAAIEVTNSLKVDTNASFLIAGEATSVTSGTGNDFDIAGAMTISDGAHVSAPLYIRLNSTGALTIDEARLETGSLINFGSPGIQISDPLGYSALTVGGEGDDGLFTGTIADGLNGAGSLVKVGTNTQILTGTNTYTGGTSITGGTLKTDNLASDLSNTGGTFSPGLSPAATTISGDYVQWSGGILEIEIAGTTQGTEYDFLEVTGTVELAGSLKVVLLDGYVPSEGEVFTILSASALTDNGLTLSLPALGDSGLVWIMEQTTTELILTVSAAETFAGFRAKYGLNPDGSDDLLDWSQNGIANILYFAFGLGDPIEANIDRTRLPNGSSENGNFVFTYIEPIATDSGISVDPVVSTDLSLFQTPAELGELPTSTTTEDLGDGYQRNTMNFPLQSSPRFFRAEISLSE